MIIGMDFGTTNSGLAIYDGGVRLLPIDPSNPFSPHVVPTTLYLTRAYHTYIGREAIDQYVERNQGRPVRLRRERVGTISLTYADLGTFARDVYVWVDELEPGRFFRSLKSVLPDRDYLGTSVWGRFYRLEDLVSLFLRRARERAERQLGWEIEAVVMGRPVVFSADADDDRLAEERLARAAILAGYQRVYFELEPVAAALSYLQQAGPSRHILVYDFGGGTLDIAVMAVDESGGTHVLATGGVRIAGDRFDQCIVRGRLTKHLGERVVYGPKRLTMPAYLYEELGEWQALLLLNRPHVRQFLAEVEGTADHPEQVAALHSLIRNNYGLLMFDQVEQAKIALSSQEQTTIQLFGESLAIVEPLSRPEFEQLIGHEAGQIAACLDDTLARSGLEAEQIDTVVRTGGSSLIPLFQHMLEQTFGPDKVQPLDEFSSVTAGLAVAAQQLAQGRIECPAYGSEILTEGQMVAAAEPEEDK